MTNAQPPETLTIKQVAEALKISTAMVHKLIREGKLPSIKENNRRYIPYDGFNDFVIDRSFKKSAKEMIDKARFVGAGTMPLTEQVDKIVFASLNPEPEEEPKPPIIWSKVFKSRRWRFHKSLIGGSIEKHTFFTYTYIPIPKMLFSIKRLPRKWRWLYSLESQDRRDLINYIHMKAEQQEEERKAKAQAKTSKKTARYREDA